MSRAGLAGRTGVGSVGGRKGPKLPVQVAPTWQFPGGWGSCGEQPKPPSSGATGATSWLSECGRRIQVREEDGLSHREGRAVPSGWAAGRREGMVGDLVSLGAGGGEWLSGPAHSAHSSVDGREHLL